MIHARARIAVVGVIGMLAAGAAAPLAAADPSHERAPSQPAGAPAHDGTPARSCRQPACRDVRPKAADRDDDQTFKPVDLQIHLGTVAVASMEGVWLTRGPRVRHEPIMVSPIVVGDAVVVALGGKF